jgi:hypothetical protein
MLLVLLLQQQLLLLPSKRGTDLIWFAACNLHTICGVISAGFVGGSGVAGPCSAPLGAVSALVLESVCRGCEEAALSCGCHVHAYVAPADVAAAAAVVEHASCSAF